MKEQQFLKVLETEAKRQAKLEQTHLLPSSLSGLASYFIIHMWKIVLGVAAALSLLRVNYL
ncbi:MAG: hypothetical protein ACOZAK_04545 [Patescibacteria group bacterium]